MRMLWLHTGGAPAAPGPAVALSVVAHLALIGGAIYGSGRAAQALEARVSEQVFYLPPPDRAPASPRVAPRIRFIALPEGVPQPATQQRGDTPAGARGTAPAPAPTPSEQDEASQRAQPAVSADDSVYSILTVDQGAVRDETSAAPIYPPELIAQQVEGSVLTRYVIDSAGRVEAGSLEVLAVGHAGFVPAVRAALPLMHFHPATIAGRHVRQMVEQNFVFRLTAPAPVAAEHTRVAPLPAPALAP